MPPPPNCIKGHFSIKRHLKDSFPQSEKENLTKSLQTLSFDVIVIGLVSTKEIAN